MISIDINLIKRSGAPKEVIEVYEYLKAYAEPEERQKWLRRREDGWDAVENEYWDSKERERFEKKNEIPLNINEIVKGLQSICAFVTAEKPEIKARPRGDNDLYVAELLQRGLSTVWIKNNGNQVIYDWAEEREVGGIGWLKVRFDPDKGRFGRIEFDDCDPIYVYFDPKSRKRDFSDTHIIVARTRTKQYIEDNYGKIPEKDLLWERDTIKEVKGEVNKSEGVTGADNYTIDAEDTIEPDGVGRQEQDIWEIEALMLKKRVEHWVIFRGESGSPVSEQFDPGDEEPETAAANAVPPGGEFIAYWKRRREVREQRIIVGRKLIEVNVNPYGMDSDGDPVINLIPLKAQRTRTAFCMSPTMYARDLNKAFCKAVMQFMASLAHNVNSPIAEAQNAVRWEGEPGTPGSRAKVDLTKTGGALQNGIMRVQPGAFQAAHFLEFKEGIRQDINSAFDSHEIMRGKVPEGTDPSGRTVLALRDMASMNNMPRLNSLESSLVLLAKCVIGLILQHWTRDQWERLIEPDEMDSWVPPEERPKMLQQQAPDMGMGGGMAGENPEMPPEKKVEIAQKWLDALERIRPMDHTKDPDLDLIDIDVKLTSGSSLPTSRIAKLDFALQMAEAGIYDRLAVLEYIDDPKADEIDARMQQKEQQMMMQEAMGG